jgi:hypothetical protein
MFAMLHSRFILAVAEARCFRFEDWLALAVLDATDISDLVRHTLPIFGCHGRFPSDLHSARRRYLGNLMAITSLWR